MMMSFQERAGVLRHAAGARAALVAAGFMVTSTMLAGELPAQHDYYNTDAGRPLNTEDAVAIEYRGFELQAAPIRLERGSGGRYQWGLEPELAYGILPRTQLEVGVPIAFLESATSTITSSGIAGVHVSLLHQLNVESRTLPAFALSAGALLPVGVLAPDDTYASLKGMVTRTFSWGRVHANAERTFGPSLDAALDGPAGPEAGELAQWTLGAAVDHTFPMRATLVGAELFAEQPMALDEPVRWTAGFGARHQLDVRWAVDGGISRRLTGDDRSWSVTLGAAYAFGIPRFRY